MSLRSDTELIREAKNGSRQALNAVFERYGERLLALVRLRMGRELRNRVESRDVLQMTLLNGFQRIEQFEGNGSQTLMAWLAAIVRNQVRDQAKFAGREGRDARREVPLEDAGDPGQALLRSEVSRIFLRDQTRQLEEALERLNPDQREIILLRRFEELTFPQIGELLGKSPDACRVQHARAMAALTLKLREVRARGAGP